MKIGEVAELAGLSAKTIRYYEEIGLLPEPEREFNQYRSYGPETLQKLAFIRRAQAANLKLREIREILEIRSQGRAPCVHVRDLLKRRLSKIDQQLEELKTAKQELEELVVLAEATDPAECSGDVICTILEP